MKLVIQRVSMANVKVDDKEISSIKKGFLVLIGINNSDTKENADYLDKKLVNMRLFEDENEKLNLALNDVNGELLLVSQFTLYGDCSKGNRPSFVEAAGFEYAKEIYDYFVQEAKNSGRKIQTGEFWADMNISSINQWPINYKLYY